MKADDIRQGLESGLEAVRETVADGWARLRRSAAGALTRFRPHAGSQLPEAAEIDDAGFASGSSWAMLGGDVFEDTQRVVVRLEAPGLDKADFDVQVQGDTLIVRGEKRFEREHTEGDGRWRVLQCAYGSFERTMPLPAAVRGEEAQASYRNGVLRVELPKASPQAPRSVKVTVG